MKILMTGMSARSVGSKKLRYDYVAFSNLMRQALIDAGHEVDMRIFKPGESLDDYDRVLVHIGWASSLSSMHVHEAGLALEAAGSKAVIYYDDWRHSPFDDIHDHVKTDKGWLRHTTKFRPEEYSRLTEQQRDTIRENLVKVIDPAGCPWPVLVPMYPGWANVDRFKEDGKKANLVGTVIPVDPTPYVTLPEGLTVPDTRERAWVFATLRNHDRWLASLAPSWEVKRIGGVKKGPGGTRPGAFGKMDSVQPEATVIQAYADNRGMLVAPYDDFLDGSGWWRPRYTFALETGTVCYVSGPRDRAFLGEPGPFGAPFDNTLEDIEAASDAELDDLAVRQKAKFDSLCGTAQEFRDTLTRTLEEAR